jgi:hypothetical protein
MLKIQIEERNWFGREGHSSDLESTNLVFGPGMSEWSLPYVSNLNLQPFDDRRAKELGFPKLMDRIWIAMVVKAEMSDGTIYDATAKFKELEEFVEKLWRNKPTNDEDIEIRTQKLRKFVDGFMSTTKSVDGK